MSIGKQFEDTLDQAGYGLFHQMERPGLTLAVVTNINDDQKLNRVKCLPIENEETEETDWCYVMAPLGGKECGQFFFPNVNDLVVLGYLGGDPHRPIVLGAFWNSEVTPPYTIEDGKVYHFSVKTPNGTELLLYDEPEQQKATLTMPSGTRLCLDEGGQAVTLADKAGKTLLTMALDKGEVTLAADTKLTLSAGDTAIVLESSGKMTQKASTEIDLEAATIKGKASNQLALQGATAEGKADSTLNLKGGAQAALSGGMVKIN